MAVSRMQFAQKRPVDDPPAVAAPMTREDQIAEAAYYRAASRGFVPGYEVDDWLAAEHEVDARVADEAHRV